MILEEKQEDEQSQSLLLLSPSTQDCMEQAQTNHLGTPSHGTPNTGELQIEKIREEVLLKQEKQLSQQISDLKYQRYIIKGELNKIKKREGDTD